MLNHKKKVKSHTAQEVIQGIERMFKAERERKKLKPKKSTGFTAINNE